MHPAVLLIGGLLLGLYLISVVRRTGGPRLPRGIGTVLVVCALAVAALMAARLIPALGAVIGALGLPLVYRLVKGLASRAPSAGGRKPNSGPHSQTSRVRTGYVEMEMEHGTGEVHGRVLNGVFVGRHIEGMKPSELAALLLECEAEDPQGARVVRAYLDKTHPGWETSAGAGSQGSHREMSRADALAILGLSGDPTRDAIIDAHRRLMQKLHPDRGGSDFLAAQINRAKDVLLTD